MNYELKKKKYVKSKDILEYILEHIILFGTSFFSMN